MGYRFFSQELLWIDKVTKIWSICSRWLCLRLWPESEPLGTLEVSLVCLQIVRPFQWYMTCLCPLITLWPMWSVHGPHPQVALRFEFRAKMMWRRGPFEVWRKVMWLDFRLTYCYFHGSWRQCQLPGDQIYGWAWILNEVVQKPKT